MKKFYIFLFSVSIGISLSAQDSWVQKDSINGANKTVCAAFTAIGKGWVVTGLDNTGFIRKMYSYKVLQDNWDNEQSMGGVNGGGLSRGSACAFSAFNKGYVCTGQGDNTDFLKDNWEYDPSLDVWTQKADFPGSARRGAVAFVIDGIAYVGTGEDASGLRKDFFKYDPVNNIWGYVSDFAGTPRKQAVGLSMGAQGYVGTGYDGIMRNDFWQYLVFQNMWVQKTNFPGSPRAGATGWGIFPNAYIATGEDNNFNYKNDVWEYDYFTDQWIQRTSLPASGRKNAISFVINGVAYLGTGYNGNMLGDFFAYSGIVGVEESLSNVEISLSPNPVSERFTLSFGTTVGNFSFLRIVAMDGRDVTSMFAMEKRENAFDVTIRNCPSGNYCCVVYDEMGNVIATRKFILQ
ncbi:MAG: hypothetical protein NT084_13870 [Bacteroidetes bacterium]|nr:hypothetical protein [Bacteroidota bacterium]